MTDSSTKPNEPTVAEKDFSPNERLFHLYLHALKNNEDGKLSSKELVDHTNLSAAVDTVLTYADAKHGGKMLPRTLPQDRPAFRFEMDDMVLLGGAQMVAELSRLPFAKGVDVISALSEVFPNGGEAVTLSDACAQSTLYRCKTLPSGKLEVQRKGRGI